MADYSEAIRLQPEQAGAYLNRGWALAKQSDHTRAAEDAERALSLDPQQPVGYLIRGLAHAAQGRHEQAIADFDRVVELDPRHTLAHNERGLAHANLGQHEQAIANYTQALRLDPKFVLSLYNRGIAYHLAGNHEAAIADLSAYLKVKPRHPLAYYNRGLAYLAARDHDRAINDFTTALQIDPQFKRAYVSLIEACKARNVEAHKNRQRRRATQVAPSTPAADPAPTTPAPPAEPQEEQERETQSGQAPPASPTRRRPRQGKTPAHELPAQPAETAVLPAQQQARPEPQPAANATGLPEPEAPEEEAEQTIEVEPIQEQAVEEETSQPDAPSQEPPPAGPDPAEDAEATATIDWLDTETTQSALPKEPINVGKVRLECPECGNHGFFDLTQLNKLIRCPSCNSVSRVDGVGGLVKVGTVDPGIEVEVQSDTGGWVKKRLPSSAATGDTDQATPSAPTDQAGKPGKPTRPVLKKLPRRKTWPWRDWARASLGLLNGPVGLGVAGVGLVVALVLFLPSLFPSQLKTRAEAVAKSWLAKDSEGIKQFTEENLVNRIDLWLKRNPPPDLSSGPAPTITVTVDRNDGRSAEVGIQIKKSNGKGPAKHYVFRHRWILKDSWVFRPSVGSGGPADEL